jgi:hypothetical protein
MDLEYLAGAYLEDTVDLFKFSFFSGWCEGAMPLRLNHRFEKVARFLGESKRREIIDDLDRRERLAHGDEWEFFKFSCGEGFWGIPADPAAVERYARKYTVESLEQGDYGLDFVNTVRAVQEGTAGLQSKTHWTTDGF